MKKKSNYKKLYQTTLEGDIVEIFETVTAAYEALNVPKATFHRRLKANKPINGYYFHYSEDELLQRLRDEFYI